MASKNTSVSFSLFGEFGITDQRMQLSNCLTNPATHASLAERLQSYFNYVAANPQSPLAEWSYFFDLLYQVEIETKLCDFLNENRQLAVRLLNYFESLFINLSNHDPNQFIAGNSTLAWSFVYLLDFNNFLLNIRHPELVDKIRTWLLQHAQQINWQIAPQQGYCHGMSALWLLAYNDCWDLLSPLVDLDLDWFATQNNPHTVGESPFYFICDEEQWHLAQRVLSRGHLPEYWNCISKESNTSVAWLLCANQQWPMIRYILAQGYSFDINIAPTIHNQPSHTILEILIEEQQWDIIGMCLSATTFVDLSKPTTVAALLNSPLAALYQPDLLQHLYNISHTQLTIELDNQNPIQRDFLQAVVNFHPSIATIQIGNEKLSSLYPETTFARQIYAQIKATSDNLLQAVLDAGSNNLGDFKQQFNLCQIDLVQLKLLENRLWHVDRLRNDYMSNFMQFVQECVLPHISNAADAQLLCLAMTQLSQHEAVSQLTWPVRAELYHATYNCLYLLDQLFGWQGLTNYQLFAYQACGAYQQAAYWANNAAYNAPNLLLRNVRQRTSCYYAELGNQLKEMYLSSLDQTVTPEMQQSPNFKL